MQFCEFRCICKSLRCRSEETGAVRVNMALVRSPPPWRVHSQLTSRRLCSLIFEIHCKVSVQENQKLKSEFSPHRLQKKRAPACIKVLLMLMLRNVLTTEKKVEIIKKGSPQNTTLRIWAKKAGYPLKGGYIYKTD